MKRTWLMVLIPLVMMACKKDQAQTNATASSKQSKTDARVSVGTDDFYGVMFSSNENVVNATPKLNDLGVRWCRVWVNISDWNTPSNNTGTGYQQAIDLHNAGFKVILHFNSLNGVVPTYTKAKAVFQWAIAKPNLKASVDIWEIFNELNNTEYYNQAHSTTLTLTQQAKNYVFGALKAGWDVFHVANAEKVLGGSWTLWQQPSNYSTSSSYNLNLTQAYLDNSYLTYCDYAGIHPYHESATSQRNFLADFKSRIGTKPIIISEWGLKPSGYTATSYTTAMDSNLSFMRSNVVTACYYRFTPGNGWFGLVTGTGYSTNIEPAYTTYKNWPKN
jgi:hypothetical protein